MRADRLVSLVLLLQGRGSTARVLAAELGVSVRTVYRDLEALGAAGIREPLEAPDVRVFRAGRISGTYVTAEPFQRPTAFELAAFWARWSAEFAASRPQFQVTLRASPEALAAFPEIFGQAAGPALEAALAPDEDGWRVVTLSFEHALAAAHRLAGFGGRVQVLSPPSVRDQLLVTARQILGRYDGQK